MGAHLRNGSSLGAYSFLEEKQVLSVSQMLQNSDYDKVETM